MFLLVAIIFLAISVFKISIRWDFEREKRKKNKQMKNTTCRNVANPVFTTICSSWGGAKITVIIITTTFSDYINFSSL